MLWLGGHIGFANINTYFHASVSQLEIELTLNMCEITPWLQLKFVDYKNSLFLLITGKNNVLKGNKRETCVLLNVYSFYANIIYCIIIKTYNEGSYSDCQVNCILIMQISFHY